MILKNILAKNKTIGLAQDPDDDKWRCFSDWEVGEDGWLVRDLPRFQGGKHILYRGQSETFEVTKKAK